MKKKIYIAVMASFMFLNPVVSFAEDMTKDLKAPYYEVQKSSEGKHNEMLVLNSGIAAFWKRIEIIRNAKKNIEVEYFIYGLDETSQAFTAELVKAAEREVKVRILVDKSAAVFVLDEYYAKAMKERNIEVKYYNDASLIRFSTVNFRNHRKLLSVDDEFAITGGRNIEDDYFDYSPEFNFMDRDVLVKGDIVKTMRESFDKFFSNKLAVTPDFPERPKDTVMRWVHRGKDRRREEVSNERAVKKYEKKMKKARAYVSFTNETDELIHKFQNSAEKILGNRSLVECPEVTFATDAPGGTFFKRWLKDYSDEYRFLRKALHVKALHVKAIDVDGGIVLSSPYVINSPKSMEVYNTLVERQVPITVYTNSLASTDAIYVAANLYTSLGTWLEKGINVHLHPGVYQSEGEEIVADVEGAKWGTHSKTQLYKFQDPSKNEFMIGTYNFDNRSNHYNTEMGLFCKGSEALFADVEDSIQMRIGKSYTITEDKKAYSPDGKKVSIYGASKKNLLLMRLIGIPSVLLQLLL